MPPIRNVGDLAPVSRVLDSSNLNAAITSATSKSKAPTPRLQLPLPAEFIQEILLHLDFWSLQKCRRLDSHFRVSISQLPQNLQVQVLVPSAIRIIENIVRYGIFEENWSLDFLDSIADSFWEDDFLRLHSCTDDPLMLSNRWGFQDRVVAVRATSGAFSSGMPASMMSDGTVRSELARKSLSFEEIPDIMTLCDHFSQTQAAKASRLSVKKWYQPEVAKCLVATAKWLGVSGRGRFSSTSSKDDTLEKEGDALAVKKGIAKDMCLMATLRDPKSRASTRK